MIALVAALQRDHLMDSADNLIMDGGSAGGLTVLLHADFFQSLLISPNVHFGAIGDAGWFRPSIQMDNKHYTQQMDTMVQASNASLHSGCISNHPENPNVCIFASNVFPFLSSKMFVLEGAYDSWQLANILGFPCATYFHTLVNCTSNDNATLEAYGQAMKRSISSAMKSSPHHVRTAGTFVSQCIIHVQSVYNEHHDVWHDQLFIKGKTPHDVVTEWYFGQGSGQAMEDCGSFGCNKYCQSYTIK